MWSLQPKFRRLSFFCRINGKVLYRYDFAVPRLVHLTSSLLSLVLELVPLSQQHFLGLALDSRFKNWEDLLRLQPDSFVFGLRSQSRRVVHDSAVSSLNHQVWELIDFSFDIPGVRSIVLRLNELIGAELEALLADVGGCLDVVPAHREVVVRLLRDVGCQKSIVLPHRVGCRGGEVTLLLEKRHGNLRDCIMAHVVVRLPGRLHFYRLI